jgi:hypothetical protein
MGDAFQHGRSMGLYEAVSLVVKQADAFGIDRAHVGSRKSNLTATCSDDADSDCTNRPVRVATHQSAGLLGNAVRLPASSMRKRSRQHGSPTCPVMFGFRTPPRHLSRCTMCQRTLRKDSCAAGPGGHHDGSP